MAQYDLKEPARKLPREKSSVDCAGDPEKETTHCNHLFFT